jgi:hypothetical protein
MSSTFLKLAVLIDSDDSDSEDALLLAAMQLRRRKTDNSRRFNFESYEESRFWDDFRFMKQDIERLIRAFRIPNELRTRQRVVFSATEGNK